MHLRANVSSFVNEEIKKIDSLEGKKIQNTLGKRKYHCPFGENCLFGAKADWWGRKRGAYFDFIWIRFEAYLALLDRMLVGAWTRRIMCWLGLDMNCKSSRLLKKMEKGSCVCEQNQYYYFLLAFISEPPPTASGTEQKTDEMGNEIESTQQEGYNTSSTGKRKRQHARSTRQLRSPINGIEKKRTSIKFYRRDTFWRRGLWYR